MRGILRNPSVGTRIIHESDESDLDEREVTITFADPLCSYKVIENKDDVSKMDTSTSCSVPNANANNNDGHSFPKEVHDDHGASIMEIMDVSYDDASNMDSLYCVPTLDAHNNDDHSFPSEVHDNDDEDASIKEVSFGLDASNMGVINYITILSDTNNGDGAFSNDVQNRESDSIGDVNNDGDASDMDVDTYGSNSNTSNNISHDNREDEQSLSSDNDSDEEITSSSSDDNSDTTGSGRIDKIFQIKVGFAGITPQICRTVLVGSCTTFRVFHRIIQILMGWSSQIDQKHLHKFVLFPKKNDGTDSDPRIVTYIDPRLGMYLPNTLNEYAVKLDEIFSDVGQKIRYIYNLLDEWEFVVTLEKSTPLLPEEPVPKLPKCVGGKGTIPPESLGSAKYFQVLVAGLKDKGSCNYNSFLQAAYSNKFILPNDDKFDPGTVDFKALRKKENQPEVKLNEEEYCICKHKTLWHGDIIQCSRKERCRNQWFHYSCAGVPDGYCNKEWTCEECKDLPIMESDEDSDTQTNGSWTEVEKEIEVVDLVDSDTDEEIDVVNLEDSDTEVEEDIEMPNLEKQEQGVSDQGDSEYADTEDENVEFIELELIEVKYK